MKRPALRFSLATMLLAITVVSIWFGATVKRVKRQQRAVAMVTEREGIIQFRHQIDEKGVYDPNKELAAPTWLRQLLGDDYFREIKVVDLSYGSGGLKYPISKIGDDDLASLASVSGIKILEISRNRKVTDAGLVHLRSLDDLETLYLHRTSVEGGGLAHIANLPRLNSLILSHSPVADIGMTHIAAMKNLRFLQLENTRVTDAGIKGISGMRRLEELVLANTLVGDGAVDSLTTLSALKRLDLTNTRVTPTGLAKLQATLPNCRISVAFGLGDEAKTPTLWTQGMTPTREQLMAALKRIHAEPEPSSADSSAPIVGLMLMDSDISDETLIQILDQLPALTSLNLRRVLVGDKLLAYLAEEPNYREQLTFLSISHSRITDVGMRDIARLTNLYEIDLTETAVTDAGFLELAAMPKLVRIQASRTLATEDGLIELQKALPDASISQ